MNGEFMGQVELLRKEYGEPIRVSSGVRCFEHNTKIGGSTGSQHITGMALDLKLPLSAQLRIRLKGLCYLIFHSVGMYNGHIHIDGRQSYHDWIGVSK